MDAGRLAPLLDGIVRIRAVQDFTPSQALAFVFALKKVIRGELGRPPHLYPLPLGGGGQGEGGEWAEDLGALDGRIDEVALLAFDLFMRCREQMFTIKADEARRRTSLLQRMQERPGTFSGPSPWRRSSPGWARRGWPSAAGGPPACARSSGSSPPTPPSSPSSSG